MLTITGLLVGGQVLISDKFVNGALPLLWFKSFSQWWMMSCPLQMARVFTEEKPALVSNPKLSNPFKIWRGLSSPSSLQTCFSRLVQVALDFVECFHSEAVQTIMEWTHCVLTDSKPHRAQQWSCTSQSPESQWGIEHSAWHVKHVS